MANRLFWFFFVVLTFVISLPATWWMQSKVDFFYPTLHQTIGIDAHIQQFAPKNLKNKTGFELTSNEERFELFHAIVEAINNDGEGLETLSYKNQFAQETRLLTEAEVLHLRDVAILLNTLKPIVLGLFVLWLVFLIVKFTKKEVFPSLKFVLFSFVILLVLSALVLSIGPEKVFNQLHEWAFPDNHQWFFYYEESLMSTMMKAPELFAYIAAIWALLSIAFSIVILKLLRIVSLKIDASNYRQMT